MKSYAELKALIDQRGVHDVFGVPGEGWGIEQNPDELARFLVHMQNLGVMSVLEIGTGYRAGLARFLDELGYEVVSVDRQDYGHVFGNVKFIVGDGENTQTRDDVARWGGGVRAYNLVLIDADHRYEAVKSDHAHWGAFASTVIAFHDIAGLRACEGVSRYWSEIAWIDQNEYKYKLKPGYYEIIAEGDQRGGIGYIVLEQKQFAEELLTGSDLTPEQINPGYGKSPLEPVPRKPITKKVPAKRTVKR